MSDKSDCKSVAVIETPRAVDSYRMSTDAAGMCKEIVLRSVQDIKGKKYVKVEGWQSIAIAHGCTASSGEVEKVEGGIRAVGKVIRMSDGMVLSQAEGFVGDDEKTWSGRAEYARRAMAQTRAISRACRSAFAHVIVMMNAGLSTTPAEEVPADGFEEHKGPEEKPLSPADVKEAFGDGCGEKTISEGQQKRLFAIAKGSGLSNDEIKAAIAAFGYEHSRDIPVSKYETIIESLQQKA